MDANEALSRLKEGNARFAAGGGGQRSLAQQRMATVAGQKPFAIVLCCSDSRAPPEHIFGAGIGEIFVVRTAGNVADAVALGSLEYAAEHLHAPLLLVMGHEGCGAVAAACASESAPGSIGAIVKAIQPAVQAGGREPARVVAENVKCVLDAIRRKSQMLSHLEKEGKLRIAGAVYSLESGEVKFL